MPHRCSWLLGFLLLSACSGGAPVARTGEDASLLVLGDGFDDLAKRSASLVIERGADGEVVHTAEDVISSVGGAFVFSSVELPPGDYRVLLWIDADSDGGCADADVVWEAAQHLGEGDTVTKTLFPPKASDPTLCPAFASAAP